MTENPPQGTNPDAAADAAARETPGVPARVSQTLAPLQRVLQHIDGESSLAGERTAHRVIEERPARHAPFPDWVEERLRTALRGRGIEALYRHQALVAEHLWQGRDAVVVTPTASGKTLCYNLPVLQSLLQDPDRRALYLFPTKALAQDQMQGLDRLIDDLGVDLKTFTYDGDTPSDARQAVRRLGHVVVTNPDMLHGGILPNHPRWQKLFRNLRFVVLDELHTYRGVFGSHVANIVRRLRRICRFHGSDPVFVGCSATIANPKELAEGLFGRPVALVGADEDGSPRGRRHVYFYNPPVVNPRLGIRAGALSQARRVASLFIEREVPTLVFCQSRLHVEVLTRYLKDRFCRRPGEEERVSGYRGGYLPNLRREVEAGIRDRRIVGVVSTNALELGMDIGQLDAVVLAGYPGSVSSTWQRIGRAGRRLAPSAAVMVASSSPLDQFVVNTPEWFFDAAPEHARIDPDNLSILVSHLRCAAYEVPVGAEEAFGGPDTATVMRYLEDAGVVHRDGDAWHYCDESYPSDGVKIRSVNQENVVIVDTTSGGAAVLAECDLISAQTMVHTGAIYMLDGAQFHVDQLDWERQKAYVHAVDVDYYTDALDYTRVRVLERFEDRSAPSCRVGHGEVHVASRVVGYKKIKLYTGENVGFGDVQLPDVETHTTSYWLTLGAEAARRLGFPRLELVDGLLGVAHAMQHMAATVLLADVHDVSRSVGDQQAGWHAHLDRTGAGVTPGDGRGPLDLELLSRFEPTVFLYDSFPGGVGFASRLYELHRDLVRRTRALVDACGCERGCPGCVGPVGEVSDRGKEVARAVLAALDGTPGAGLALGGEAR